MYITSYLNRTYFYLEVSISIRDLRQKKLVQFFFRFLHSSEVKHSCSQSLALLSHLCLPQTHLVK